MCFPAEDPGLTHAVKPNDQTHSHRCFSHLQAAAETVSVYCLTTFGCRAARRPEHDESSGGLILDEADTVTRLTLIHPQAVC